MGLADIAERVEVVVGEAFEVGVVEALHRLELRVGGRRRHEVDVELHEVEPTRRRQPLTALFGRRGGAPLVDFVVG